jgi:nucleotide-binding universal stress UspA family protein
VFYNNVLVPLDGSKLAESVLPHIQAITEKGLVTNITFIRVIESARIPTIGDDAEVRKAWNKMDLELKWEAEIYLENLVGSLNFPGVNLKWAVLPSMIVHERIIQYALENNIDLIIMATHGRSGISRLVLGSVAYHVLRSGYIPVLMIRPHTQG